MKPLSLALASVVFLHVPSLFAQETPAPASASASAPATKPNVVIVLKSSSPAATLERRTGTTSVIAFPAAEGGLFEGSVWEQTCHAPCEVPVDPKATYRVAGDGLVPSDSFSLPSNSNAVELDADMGSARYRLGGWALMGLGAASVLAGTAALIATPTLESNGTGSETFRAVVKDGGYAAIGLGALSAGVGLYLVLTNGTSVKSGLGYQVADAPMPSIPLPGKLALTPRGVVF